MNALTDFMFVIGQTSAHFCPTAESEQRGPASTKFSLLLILHQEASENEEEEREEEEEENTDYLTDSNKENETDEENNVR